MQRIIMIAAAFTLLALPMFLAAEETVIPPEANWSATPPARVVVDAEQLMKLLVKKGVITPVEQAELSKPAATASATDEREMGRRDGIDSVSQP
ncbi:MAG TPA: hypothetical protein VNP04_27150 [Alphaproteobacteria bacterium]|nr:hypothetical protein [Alphaproteobacteria bacterium]